MINFFKPEDFEGLATLYQVNQAVEWANAKLEREGKVVWSKSPHAILSNHYQPWTNVELADPTHKALLINIEPIEKCKHEIEKVSPNMQYHANAYTGWKCECGAKVRPTSFEEIE